MHICFASKKKILTFVRIPYTVSSLAVYIDLRHITVNFLLLHRLIKYIRYHKFAYKQIFSHKISISFNYAYFLKFSACSRTSLYTSSIVTGG